MSPTARFINGVFPFAGKGLDEPVLLPKATYTVPADKRAQLVYFRAGNTEGELVYVALTKNGKILRFFPLGAKASLHVPLAVVEDIFPETKIDVLIGAARGVAGAVVLDIGFVEVD
jgi:hypothetical protein